MTTKQKRSLLKSTNSERRNRKKSSMSSQLCLKKKDMKMRPMMPNHFEEKIRTPATILAVKKKSTFPRKLRTSMRGTRHTKREKKKPDLILPVSVMVKSAKEFCGVTTAALKAQPAPKKADQVDQVSQNCMQPN